jgi:hypothetical protein
MRIISVFLIAGMVDYSGRESYTLTIVSAAGGSVTTPGEGNYTYYEGMVAGPFQAV